MHKSAFAFSGVHNNEYLSYTQNAVQSFGWPEGPRPKDCVCLSLPPSLPEADILNFNAMTLKFGTQHIWHIIRNS